MLDVRDTCFVLATIDDPNGFQFGVAGVTAGAGTCTRNAGFVGEPVFDRSAGAWDVSGVEPCISQSKSACAAMASGYELACATKLGSSDAGGLWSEVRACETPDPAYYLDGDIALRCEEQVGCASSSGVCSSNSTAGITDRQGCTEASAGYVLVGDRVIDKAATCSSSAFMQSSPGTCKW